MASDSLGLTPEMLEPLYMILASLPVPPLPIILMQPPKTPDGEPEEKVHNSHDIFLGLLLGAIRADSEKDNAARKKKQSKAMDEIRNDLWRAKDAQAAYTLMCRFTADYMSAFSKQDTQIRFKPMDWVNSTDVCFKASCSWCAGHDIQWVKEPKQRKTAEYFSTLSFTQIIDHIRIRAIEAQCQLDDDDI